MKILIMVLVIVLLPMGAFGETEFFNKFGDYEGKINDYGEIRDKWGNYQGEINDRGEIRDKWGNYQGEIKSDDEPSNPLGDYGRRPRRLWD